MDELARLARQVSLLAGPWQDQFASDKPDVGRLSASVLAELIARRRQKRRELAATVERQRQILHSGHLRLTAAGGRTPPTRHDRLRRALRAAVAQLKQQQSALAGCERELAALEKAAVIYPRLLACARQALRAVPPHGPPAATPVLEQAEQELTHGERLGQILERLAGLWEQNLGGLALYRREGAGLLIQAEHINREIDRLDLACRGEPSPSRLACLAAALDELAPRAQALQERLKNSSAHLARDLDQARRCRRAWRQIADRRRDALGRSAEHLERAQQYMQGARDQVRCLQGTATAVSRCLGGLRPRELDAEVTALALRAWELELPCLHYEKRLGSLLARLAAARPSPPLPEPLPPGPQDQRLLAGDWLELSRLHGLQTSVQQVLQRTLESMLAAERSRQERESRQNRHQVQELRQRLERADQRNQRLSGVLEHSLERQRRLRRLQRQSQERLNRVLAAQDRQQAEGQHLSAELAAARREVERWQGLARSLSISLALAQRGADQDNLALRGQVDSLQGQVAHLQQQLQGLGTLVSLTSRAPAKSRPAALRLISLSQEQVEQAMGRLAAAGRHLQRMGRSQLAQWALIIGLTSGLVLMPQSHATEATPRDVRVQPYSLALKAEFGGRVPAAALDLHLLPLHYASPRAAVQADPSWRRLAQQAGVAPEVLYASARSHYPRQRSLEASLALGLAGRARGLALRHPLIHQDLARHGLPSEYTALLALTPPAEQGANLFLDRMYQEYRRLGYEPRRALQAVIANERASAAMSEAWRLPHRYRGRVQPLAAVEKMGLARFLDRISPFIADRCERFLRHLGRRVPRDLERYARDLAFDMYGAAKKFKVPVSFLLAIAHQETFYANVLGDQNRSASPFQIFRPTLPHIINSMRGAGFAAPPRRIRLQHHLTMATYLAAFHLRELMQEAYLPPRGRRAAAVDMDRVMRRYNGSSAYAPRVALRRAELARFLRQGG